MREELQSEPGLTDKGMFGGWAWLLYGNLLCGAREDGMLIRLGRDKEGWALKVPGIVPMISRGRRMHGWVRAGPGAYMSFAESSSLCENVPNPPTGFSASTSHVGFTCKLHNL